MATYTFQPPNCQSFSDEVISVVVPRPSPPRSRIQDPSPPSLNPILLNSRSTPAAPAISAALRERRRLNQARYRHRQRGLIQRLEEESAQLQEEIERLGAWRQKKLIDAPTYKSLWNIASEYFHLFQRALRPLPAAEHVHGLSFLESVMVPDVICASGSGMYALLDNWVLLSHFFEDIHVDLERMDKASVVATTTTSVTISANALRRAFPHLVNEAEQGESWPPLSIKLLGQRVVMRGSVYFQWNDKATRVAVIQSESDMLSPILNILGNLTDVSRVFDEALISPTFRPVTRET